MVRVEAILGLINIVEGNGDHQALDRSEGVDPRASHADGGGSALTHHGGTSIRDKDQYLEDGNDPVAFFLDLDSGSGQYKACSPP